MNWGELPCVCCTHLASQNCSMTRTNLLDLQLCVEKLHVIRHWQREPTVTFL